MSEKRNSSPDETWFTRRDFLKTSALLGGGGAVAVGVPRALALLQETGAGEFPSPLLYELARPANILHSVCLQCNTGCGIKVKLLDGVAVKIDGNPRAPQCLYPHLPADSSPFDTATVDGTLCPKGQAGLQTAYDPYRLRKVLRRTGKRGENQWQTISFDQAIAEIVEGGVLFRNVPGEENRKIEGLREIWALRDPKVAKEMEEDLKALKKVIKEVRKHKQPEGAIGDAIAQIKQKHSAHLNALIDPDHPDLGPRNNQCVFLWGRVKAGRGELIKRFISDAFGSCNAHGHTTVCQGSLYFTGKAMSEQWDYDEKSHEVKWTGGDKFYWQADTGGSEFIIFVGASPFEANYGPPGRTPRITGRLAEGDLKIAVVDPRLSKTAAKAWKWVPAKPGSEGALASAMIQWIIEAGRFDARYLANANKAAAQADGEPNWCNATWLVKVNEKGDPEKFLRAQEIGLAPPRQKTNDAGDTYEYELFVVLKDGKPVAVDPNDDKLPVEGDLLVDTTVNGIRIKSALQLLYESARSHTLEEWADLCGIKATDIVELAHEFTSHGKKAAADIHRGVSQHTNGFYNVLAWYSLNLLIGNFDWQGGMVKASAWNVTGDKAGKVIEHMPFIFKELHPHKAKPFGVSLIRHDVKYEETTLFEGYPARRPFFPLSSDVYQEVIPSIGDAYPYAIKALFLYMGTPAYSLPAGQTCINVLSDVDKLPLFVASDIVIGETSMYADYIFPDLSYLERWEFHGSHPSFTNKIQPVRQPVIAPIPETVRVFGEEMPISLEALVLAVAEKMGLPGFGKDGFGPGRDFNRAEDFYLKMAANVAVGDKPDKSVPDADDREMDLFVQSRRHLPASVFDPQRWQQAVKRLDHAAIQPTDLWRKVVYVLNRGGRFEDFDKGYDGEKVKHAYAKLINMYSEKAATARNSMTGEPFSGIARYFPITDALGRELDDETAGFDLHLITYRDIMMTKSRTISDYWLTAVLPENAILMNRRDADRRGLQDSDEVQIISPTNPEGVWDLRNGHKKPMRGKVRVIEGIRPGVIAFSLGHGHWAYGANDVVIDGEIVPGDPRRATGIHANAAMRIDPHLKNVTLQDLTGGSVAFYDSKVKVVRVA